MGLTILFAVFLVLLVLLHLYGNKTESFFSSEGIPKIIIQTWKTSTLTNPTHIMCQRKLLELHPNFKYLFFDDKEVDDFMDAKFPEHSLFYRRLATRIQQIDFFRLCALYHYGGFYMDLDMYPLQRLTPLCRKNTLIIPEEHSYSLARCHRLQQFARYPDFPCEKKTSLGNYALASPAKNPQLAIVIDRIIRDYDKVQQNRVHRLVYVYITTGPDKITQIYYTDENVRKNAYILRNRHSTAYFGDYARHLAAGSWK